MPLAIKNGCQVAVGLAAALIKRDRFLVHANSFIVRAGFEMQISQFIP
jgi:hypothetical protein